MRKTLITLLILISFGTLFSQEQSQEFNIGVQSGFGLNQYLTSIQLNVEYKSKLTFLSINTEPGIKFSEENIIGHFPVFINLILGKKHRFCPVAGVFINSNSHRGTSIGLRYESIIANKYIPFIKCELIGEHYNESTPSHFGTGSTASVTDRYIWLSAGLKIKLLK